MNQKQPLKYYLDNRNFAKVHQKKAKKKEDAITVVDGNIVLNNPITEDAEDEIVTSYTYMNKKNRSKKWTKEETNYFYKSLECCGCDFSMINILFPDRSRNNIKLKYKKELKFNPRKVEDSMDCFRNFNLEKFNQLKEELRKLNPTNLQI